MSGCIYGPERCVMPDPFHLATECATAEDMEAQADEADASEVVEMLDGLSLGALLVVADETRARIMAHVRRLRAIESAARDHVAAVGECDAVYVGDDADPGAVYCDDTGCTYCALGRAIGEEPV